MKLNLSILTIISCCHVLNLQPIKETAQIIAYEYVQHPNSSYFYSYETSDGEAKKEFGNFIEINGNKVLSIEGSYRFIGDDGEEHRFKYTAGVNGFHVVPDETIEFDDRVDPNIIKSLLG
ncbi:larval cuticle protein 65Ag1-like [Chironomus tepperi]|uniref:larval cuticle protein 65Ag1-like n=1 Tax=Chironomus tepperi TaxID=113505 RepID=UPI00391F1AA3